MSKNPLGYWRTWYHRKGNAQRRSEQKKDYRHRVRRHYFRLANYTCHYCHRGPLPGRKLQLDHKAPLLLPHGTGRQYRFNDPNIVVACSKCNHDKATMTYEQYMARLAAAAYVDGSAQPDPTVAGGFEPDLEPA